MGPVKRLFLLCALSTLLISAVPAHSAGSDTRPEIELSFASPGNGAYLGGPVPIVVNARSAEPINSFKLNVESVGPVFPKWSQQLTLQSWDGDEAPRELTVEGRWDTDYPVIYEYPGFVDGAYLSNGRYRLSAIVSLHGGQADSEQASIEFDINNRPLPVQFLRAQRLGATIRLYWCAERRYLDIGKFLIERSVGKEPFVPLSSVEVIGPKEIRQESNPSSYSDESPPADVPLRYRVTTVRKSTSGEVMQAPAQETAPIVFASGLFIVEEPTQIACPPIVSLQPAFNMKVLKDDAKDVRKEDPKGGGGAEPDRPIETTPAEHPTEPTPEPTGTGIRRDEDQRVNTPENGSRNEPGWILRNLAAPIADGAAAAAIWTAGFVLVVLGIWFLLRRRAP
jgi:hypothetical protein